MTSRALRSQLRQWYPLALVFLTVGLSTSMAYPFLALFLTTAVHADPLRVSVYLVTGPVAGVVVAQLIGRLSDRRHWRRRLLITAAIAGVAAMSVNALSRDYWVLLAVVATLSAVAGSMMSQGFAYARTVLAGSNRAAMTASALRMLFSLAWVGGPPAAALIQSRGGFSALYATAAGMYAAAMIVVLALLPEPAPARDPHQRPPAEPVPVDGATGPVAPGHDTGRAGTDRPADAADANGTAAPLANRDAPFLTIAGTIVAFVLLQGASTVGVQMLSLFLETDLHAGVGQAGLILGLCAGLEIPLMLTFGALSTRIPLRRLILFGPLFSVVYLLLAASAHHTWVLFAGQLLNAMSIAAVQGLGVSYVQDMMPRHPGKASALYGNSFAAGTVMSGPLIAGAETFGYRTAYAIAAGICLVGFALIAVSGPPRSRTAAEEQPAAQPVAA